MKEEFVSELIEPAAGSGDPAGMVKGEPGFPRRFFWRGKEYETAEVLAAWKEDGPCKAGSGEKYLRKHWYRIKTTEGQGMKIYFERQGRSKKQIKKRWWLYTVTKDE